MNGAQKEQLRHVQRVEEMPIFQTFYGLALMIESASRSYGADFRWLRGQTIRASESICANMTEGFYSQYSTEYLQTLYRCRREARETTIHLRYAVDVGQLRSTKANELLSRYDGALRELSNFINSIERKIKQRGKAKPST